jgi:predicted O-methyltransferase YrrM
MKKTLIYGTSTKATEEVTAILLNHDLIGFVDSDIQKQNQKLLNLPVYHFTDLKHVDYELIIICSDFFAEIEQTLRSLEIKDFVNSNDINYIEELSSEIRNRNQLLRKRQVSAMPKTPLLTDNIENCRLITNRIKLLELLPKNGVVAELGVATGCFSTEILNFNEPEKLHLVDVWGCDRYHEGLLNNIKNMYSKKIKAQEVILHRKLSHDAASDFEDGYFDWIYIDTTHSYAQTKLELEVYAPKIKPGGIIAGHDYLMGNWEKSFKYGVIEAVHEFCVSHHYEFIYLTMDLSENQSFAIRKIVKK